MRFRRLLISIVIFSILIQPFALAQDFQPSASFAALPPSGGGRPPPGGGIPGLPHERGGALGGLPGGFVDFIEARVDMRAQQIGGNIVSTPVLKFINVPAACKQSNSKFTLLLSINNGRAQALDGWTNRGIYEVIIQGSSFTPNASLFPVGYKSGRFDFVIEPKDNGCMPPASISFSPQLPSEFGSFLSPFVGFDLPAGASFGDALKSFAFSFALDYIFSTVLGKVPTSDQAAKDTIKKSFGESLTAQLEQIKQQMIQTLKEAAQYIALRIFNSIITRLFQTVSKLQIKDPQMYGLLNAMGGMFIGMHKFQEKGCIDPATVACYQANLNNMVQGFKNQTADTRIQQSAQLGLAALVARMPKCNTSKIDEVITPTEPIQPPGRGRGDFPEGDGQLQANTLFRKIPFFAQVLESRGNQGLTAQVRRGSRSRAFTPKGPVGNFVEGSLVNIMQSQLCQNVSFDLQNIVTASITDKLEQAQKEIELGVQGVKRCVQPIPGMPPNIPCKEEQVTTSAGTVKHITNQVADSERQLALAKQASPDPAVNVFVSWFRNWLFTKINTTLLKGLDEANDIPRTGNTALTNLGNRANLEKTCRSLESAGGTANTKDGKTVGGFYRQACEEAHKSQIGMGAEFDSLEAKELTDQYQRVLTKLQNVISLYSSLSDLFNETRAKFEAYLTSLSAQFVIDWSEIEAKYTRQIPDNIDRLLTDLCGILKGTKDAVAKTCKDIKTGILTDLIRDLENARSPSSAAGTAISGAQKELVDLQAQIFAIQQDIQKDLIVISQGLSASQLASLFYQRAKASPDYSSIYTGGGTILNFSFFKGLNTNFVEQFINQTDTNQKLRNRYTNIRNVPNDKILYDNDLVYFLNQDLAAPATSLQSYGILQAAANYLGQVFSTDNPLTEKQLKAQTEDIRKLNDYFGKKKIIYQRLASVNLSNQTINLVIGFGQIQQVSISAILGEMNNMVPALVDALTKIQDSKIQNLSLIQALQKLKQKEEGLGVKRTERDKDVDEKFDAVLQALSSADLDFPAAEVSLNKIETDVEFLYNDTLLLRNELASFYDDLIDEIKNLPPEAPPEEPSAQSQAPRTKADSALAQGKTKSTFSKILSVITLPVKAVKLLLGNIFSINDERRVKLK